MAAIADQAARPRACYVREGSRPQPTGADERNGDRAALRFDAGAVHPVPPTISRGDRTDRGTNLSDLGDVIAAELGLSEEKLRRLQELLRRLHVPVSVNRGQQRGRQATLFKSISSPQLSAREQARTSGCPANQAHVDERLTQRLTHALAAGPGSAGLARDNL